MPMYVIERNIPGAADLGPDQLREIAQTSNAVVDGLERPYTWHLSYVAGDKVYCVHEADDADTVYEHARRGGFPADVVTEVANVIDPATADAPPAATTA